jgi:hypothetical protein
MRRCAIAVAGVLGCAPHQPPFVYSATVRGMGEPLGDAVVILSCGSPSYAQRTDAGGRIRIMVHRAREPEACTATVAKPGFATAVARTRLCRNTGACVPERFELFSLAPRATDPSPAEEP